MNLALIDVYNPGTVGAAFVHDYLYELVKERAAEGMPIISKQHHRQFISRRQFRFWYVIRTQSPWGALNAELEEHLVGSITATHDNAIGIVLGKDWRGKGYGPEAIRRLMERHKPSPTAEGGPGAWRADIALGNDHSRHVFTKLGFRKVHETFEFQSPIDEEAQDG